jgi:hypothetical protein
MATHTLGGHSALTGWIADVDQILEDRRMAEQEPRDDRRAPRERSSGKPSSAGGDRKPYAHRDGDRKPYQQRDGERKPYQQRDGERKPYQRDGERKPYQRDGERKPYQQRDGERKPYQQRDGDRKPYQRDGDRKPYERSARPTRGGADRPDRAVREDEIRPVRARHDDPFLPDEVTAHDLPPGARNELKTLSKENADQVARYLAMASKLIDDDPELAHQHALSASRRAGRIAIVRETLAITAYATGDFALALRELRTYRRISGSDDQIALMVDSERGVGRADRALELGRSVDRSTLETSVRVELAIAMSGARLDLGEPERALQELDIPELDPDRAFEWSPALFAARAAVLEELGRTDEAEQWQRRALVAGEAIDAASGLNDLETVYVEEVLEEGDDDDDLDDAVVDDAVVDDAVVDDDADDDDPDDADDLDDEDDPDDAEIAEVDDAAPVSEPEQFTVADEVAELLVEAGVDEPSGDAGADEADR